MTNKTHFVGKPIIRWDAAIRSVSFYGIGGIMYYPGCKRGHRWSIRWRGGHGIEW